MGKKPEIEAGFDLEAMGITPNTAEHMDLLRDKSNRLRKEKREERIKQLAYFDAMTKDDRRRQRLPHTDAGLAENMGVSVSSIRKWRRDPMYEQTMKEERSKILAKIDPRAEVILDAAAQHKLANDDLLTYEKVKAGIAAGAMEGDARSIEVYLKHWGNTFVQQETTRVDVLADYTDEQLLLEIAELVQHDALTNAMAQVAERWQADIDKADLERRRKPRPGPGRPRKDEVDAEV